MSPVTFPDGTLVRQADMCDGLVANVPGLMGMMRMTVINGGEHWYAEAGAMRALLKWDARYHQWYTAGLFNMNCIARVVLQDEPAI